MKSVVRLGELAGEMETEIHLSNLKNSALMRIKGDGFMYSSELDETEVVSLILTLLDSYNGLYNRGRTYDPRRSARFIRHVALDLAEIAMHERILAQCMGKGTGQISLMDEIISQCERLAETCDIILSI